MEQSETENRVASTTQEGDIRDVPEPDQVLRENAESRSICALIGLNSLWIVMAAIEWYNLWRRESLGRGMIFSHA